ncbi:hypothetical protein CYMTET_28174 [Cymbomonas tetramitiformis]|uniref:Uncharacterized protein n=1 Tax=Cymbomonas tetramitiformis TaxID=36881 RepID=A0AAE0KWH1_9CHLO|nr:hypothetical protein CYMTET_28174 [Cymbomonas tetramitiformis]
MGTATVVETIGHDGGAPHLVGDIDLAATGPAVATSTGGSASGSPPAPGALKPDVGEVAGLGASGAGKDSSNLPGTAVTGPSAGRPWEGGGVGKGEEGGWGVEGRMEKKARPVFSSLPLAEEAVGAGGGAMVAGGREGVETGKGIQEGLKPASCQRWRNEAAGVEGAEEGEAICEGMETARCGMAEGSEGGCGGEEGAEEGRGRNYSTKLVKVERLLSLRLALLLVLLLMVLRGVTLLKVLLLRRRLLLKRMRRVLMRHPGGGEEGGVP